MSERNPDLVALQAELADILDRLVQAQETATTADAVRAIAREIAEVNHRITIVGQLLFRQQTQKIAEAVVVVRDGRAKLDAAIARIEKVNAFIKAMSSFLGLVDKALDVAKLL